MGIKAGCAIETSNPKTSIGSFSYMIYLPYADIKYKLSKVFDFKLKYRSNSEYPSLAQINPFESRIDNQSVRIGNPLLKPEVTHRLSIETNIFEGIGKNRALLPLFEQLHCRYRHYDKRLNDAILIRQCWKIH